MAVKVDEGNLPDIGSGIRSPLLIHLGLGLLFLVLLTVTGFYWYAEDHLEQHVRSLAESVDKMFRQQWERDAHLLHSLSDSLQEDSCIRDAFVARDRGQLLSCAQPHFDELRTKYQVSHLYFHSLDKTNFLRMHHPQRHGDPIERFTLNAAVETGRAFQGIELGTFGSFVLRVVHPWRVDGKLIGYLELGKELSHIAPNIKASLGADLLIVIGKKFTTHSNWEEGQRILGRHEDWDEYPEFVVTDRTTNFWIPDLQVMLHQYDHSSSPKKSFKLNANGNQYRIGAVPLKDVSTREVGYLIVIANTTDATAHLLNNEYHLVWILTLLAGLLMGLLWMHLGRYQRSVYSSFKAYEAINLDCQRNEKLQAKKAQELARETLSHQRTILEEQILGALLRLALKPTSREAYIQASLEQLISSIQWMEHLPQAVVFVVDGSTPNSLQLAGSYNLPPELNRLCAQVSFGTCLCGRAAAAKEPFFSSDVTHTHEIHFEGMVPHGHYITPLMKDDELVGIFNLYLPSGVDWDELDASFMRRVGEILVLGLENRRNGSCG